MIDANILGVEGYNILYMWMVIIGFNLIWISYLTGLAESRNKKILIATIIPGFVAIAGFIALFFGNIIDLGMVSGSIKGIFLCLFAGLITIIIGLIIALLFWFDEWIWEILKSET